MKLIFLIVLFIVFPFKYIEGKTTMEMLINKEWYELDLAKMQTYNWFYVKFTGTQRIIVRTEEDGSMKMRVQKYYLSNKTTDRFDSTQVGKHRDGKYIILQGVKRKDYMEAVCMELYQLEDLNMRMGDIRFSKAEQQCYVAENEFQTTEETEERGMVISTQDLLVEKMWYEIDEKTGKRKRTEVLFDKDGMALHCTMAENYKKELPDWQMYEFYFSDGIEPEFHHTKIGKRINGIYLVVKEKDETGEWYAANYDISTLSSNRLVLDCVYPPGIPTRTFTTRAELEKKHKINKKTQRWQLMENTWYHLDTVTWQRRDISERFDSVNVIRRYTVIENGMRAMKERKNVYYLSNSADSVFDYSKVGKSLEGDYVVINEHTHNGGSMAVSYKVDYINEKNMLLSSECGSKSDFIAYERDLSETEREEIRRNELLSKKKQTTLDYLAGHQWRFVKLPDSGVSKWERWYFTDSLWAEVDFVYDEFKKVWETRVSTRAYYLSDFAHHNFSFYELDKKRENGSFINFYRDVKVRVLLSSPTTSVTGKSLKGFRPLYGTIPERRSYAYELCYLSDFVMILMTVPIDFNPNNTTHISSSRAKIYHYVMRSD